VIRILLVEDDASTRDSIAWMLGREPDFDVVAQATTLAEARGRLQAIDVAVVDLGLPDGFGAELVADLRGVNPHAKTLILTASIDDLEIARAYAYGATAVLIKGAQLDQLTGTVRRISRDATAAAAP
jgi:DNA-binding NarL/FixJ family response regulator